MFSKTRWLLIGMGMWLASSPALALPTQSQCENLERQYKALVENPTASEIVFPADKVGAAIALLDHVPPTNALEIAEQFEKLKKDPDIKRVGEFLAVTSVTPCAFVSYYILNGLIHTWKTKTLSPQNRARIQKRVQQALLTEPAFPTFLILNMYVDLLERAAHQGVIAVTPGQAQRLSSWKTHLQSERDQLDEEFSSAMTISNWVKLKRRILSWFHVYHPVEDDMDSRQVTKAISHEMSYLENDQKQWNQMVHSVVKE